MGTIYPPLRWSFCCVPVCRQRQLSAVNIPMNYIDSPRRILHEMSFFNLPGTISTTLVCLQFQHRIDSSLLLIANLVFVGFHRFLFPTLVFLSQLNPSVYYITLLIFGDSQHIPISVVGLQQNSATAIRTFEVFKR